MNGVNRWLCAIGAVLCLATPLQAETISGRARLIDGDTLVISGRKIRLFGIDAPETGQQCTDGERSYPCGVRATKELARLIAGHPVSCRGEERDRYDRLLAWCRAGRTDLNREMVRLGWAVAFRKFTDTYLAEELEAAKAGAGVWRGRFERPTVFRAARWAVAEQVSPDGCPIKGNISSRGRIYHTPWSRHYSRTRIDISRGERWFCSEAEAVAAGWRAPLR